MLPQLAYHHTVQALDKSPDSVVAALQPTSSYYIIGKGKQLVIAGVDGLVDETP